MKFLTGTVRAFCRRGSAESVGCLGDCANCHSTHYDPHIIRIFAIQRKSFDPYYGSADDFSSEPTMINLIAASLCHDHQLPLFQSQEL